MLLRDNRQGKMLNDGSLVIGTGTPAFSPWVENDSPESGSAAATASTLADVQGLKFGVLLLDEITSALDPELVGEVLDVVRELKGSGITLLFATHEMAFAREISDRVCSLSTGTIAEQGPPQQIFSNPSDDRTRRFLQRVIGSDRLSG